LLVDCIIFPVISYLLGLGVGYLWGKQSRKFNNSYSSVNNQNRKQR
jgi:hypothetical protein